MTYRQCFLIVCISQHHQRWKHFKTTKLKPYSTQLFWKWKFSFCFFVILQHMIYKKRMTVSASIWSVNAYACENFIRFRGTKILNRWYTHSIGLKDLQSETLPQKTQSLISCWKPSFSSELFSVQPQLSGTTWYKLNAVNWTSRDINRRQAYLHCLGVLWGW